MEQSRSTMQLTVYIFAAFSLLITYGDCGTNIKNSFVLTSNAENLTLVVRKGDSFLLVCGHPNEWVEGSRVTWLKDGIPMEQDDFPRTILSNLNLHFQRVQLKDAGIYSCEVRGVRALQEVAKRSGNLTVLPRNGGKKQAENYTNETEELGSDDEDEEGQLAEIDRSKSCALLEERMNLTTTSEPYLCFDLDKKNKEMKHYFVKPAGSSMTFFCNVRGNSKPTIRWFKDKLPFVTYGYRHKIGKNNLSIQIQDSNPSDDGVYTCEASNDTHSISYETEFYAIQRASSVPIFEEAPTNVTQVVGSMVELRVKILSDPEYSLVWIKHIDSDLNTSNYNVTRVESRTNNLELKENNHILVLENVTLDDEGWYSCVAGNSIGVNYKSAYVTVLRENELKQSDRTADVLASSSTNYILIITIATSVAVFVAVITFQFYSCWKKHKYPQRSINETKSPPHWIKQVNIERRPVDDNDERAIMIPEVNIKSVESNKSNQEYELPMDISWEFSRECLHIGKQLGEGAFGEVKLGIADGIVEQGVKTTVAVKSLKKSHTDAEMIDLISEMETMKELGKHMNIINLLGCCTQAGELLVIMEFAEHGNLRDFLRNNRHQFLYERPRKAPASSIVPIDVNKIPADGTDDNSLTFTDLMSMAYQVARGMDYLVQRKYVHRDLAARNVLVCTGKIVKIADFGMTRSTFANDYYRKKSDGRVPVKWMAPETLFHRIYTTQSDVWSYGVLLWEIVTLGGTPYPSMPDVNKLLDFLKSGHRMEQPSNCPTELYLIMRDCWMDSPASRPSFGDLVEDIGRILYIASGTEYMDLEGVRPIEYGIIETPPSSPENSAMGIAMFDPEFVKSFTEP